MKWSIWLTGVRQQVIVLFLLVSLLIIYPVLYRIAINNLVWLALAQRTTGGEVARLSIIEAALAPQMREVAKTNARTSMGLGVLAAFGGDEPTALALWQQGKNIDQLIAFGQRAQAQGLLDLAILFFSGAGDMAQEQGWYGIGKVCQGIWVRLERLTPTNQTRCRHFFEQNGLLLNGDFASGNLDGWTALGKAAAVVIETGISGPAARIDGQDASRMIYQRIYLAPGTVIRFSAYVRIRGEISSNFRLLYLGFKQPDGSSVGNFLAATDANLIPYQWTFVERTYTLPPAQVDRYLFAPAQVRGSGQIEVDQVRLEILEQP